MLNLKKVFNSRAQSSVTDAMYFLIIIAGLSAFMFVISNSYGQSIDRQMDSQYRVEYANSALKTVLYSSLPRNVNQSLAESTEVDYLLTAIKEDYANTRSLSPQTQLIVLDTVKAVMQPVSSAFDFMFFIYLPERVFADITPSGTGTGGTAVSTPGGTGTDASTTPQASQLVLLILKKTPIQTGSPISGRPDLGNEIPTGRNAFLVNNEVYFFCQPPDFQFITNRILPRLANLAKPLESRVYLSVFQRLGAGTGTETFDARANLILWTPTQFTDDELTKLDCDPESTVRASLPASP
ncbi:MAG: hypothetical protein Q7S92_07215 [Candidatus Diapherotrites archaeon]|nr:hypothetical protein [Candidatus Diapherotrites archaeon]